MKTMKRMLSPMSRAYAVSGFSIRLTVGLALVLAFVNASATLAAEEVKLSKYTAFGTPTTTPDCEFDKASDGKTDTRFTSSELSGYTGIDLGEGNARKIVKIRFFSTGRDSWPMKGGKIQGSNTNAEDKYTDLYTIPEVPKVGWNEVKISDPMAYRYLRYTGGDWNVVIAEMEFYTEATSDPADDKK